MRVEQAEGGELPCAERNDRILDAPRSGAC
jgi:hypothetical protein